MKKRSFKKGDLVGINPSHRDSMFIGLQDDIGVVVDSEPWGERSRTLLRVYWVVRQADTFMSNNYLCRLVDGESHAP